MDLSAFRHLKVTVDEPIRAVFVEFDHGKANEMGKDQLTEIEALGKELEGDAAMTLITFSRRRSAKGTRIFVAGANVTERASWPSDVVQDHVRWQRRVLAHLRGVPQFHVAVVDGVALGWGTEFLLACDWRIAGNSAEFALPETGLGILPGAGGTSELWAQIGAADTLRLGMTGERVGADDALRIGLVQERCADVDAGLARARALAGMVATRSPTAVAAFKQGVLASIGQPWPIRAETEARAYEHCLASGDASIGRAYFEQIRDGERPPWRPRVAWRR